MLHLVLLVLATLLFAIGAALSGPGFTWQRAVSIGLACLSASFISW